MARTLDVFPSAVAFIVLPKAASRPVEEVVALVGRGVRASTSVTLLAGVVLAILGPWALKLIYGQEFLTAVPVFRLLLAQAVLGGATWVLAQAFMASDKPGMVSIMQGIGVGLTVPLLVVLVPRYGLVGAGLAMLISTATRFVFVLVNFPITLGIRPPGFRPRWSDFTSMLRRGGNGGEAKG
jgi:O-antigen/teichoic acid export membrane protein